VPRKTTPAELGRAEITIKPGQVTSRVSALLLNGKDRAAANPYGKPTEVSIREVILDKQVGFITIGNVEAAFNF
jgi:hypothetical protein